MAERGTKLLWLLGVLIVAAGAGWLFVSALGGGEPTPTDAAPAPRFVEEIASGVDHVYDGDFTFFVGGGVAAFDCSADGYPDLYVAGGSNAAALYRNESTERGDLRFRRIVAATTDLDHVTGAYPIDIDGDGILDLVVTRLGQNVALRGTGDCRFEPANEQWALPGGDAWTVGFSATWEDPAGMPTLAFGNYIRLDENGQQFGGCEDNVLLRPEGAGYGEPTPLSPGWCALSVLFSDWDGSGHSDLRVTNDRHYYRDGEEQLWEVLPGKPPRLYTRNEGWQKIQIWGMGIASQDITGDGTPEVYLTSQADNKLQTLVAGATGPEYTDIAIRRGATAHRPFTGDEVLPSTAWHPEFQDVNNDGFVDLFISKGNVEATPGYAVDDPNNLLLGQPDGTFVEGAEEAGIVDFTPSRGAALVDFNLDGHLDLVYVNRRDVVRVWRNLGTENGHWLAIKPEQVGPNRNAIGARLEVRVGDTIVTRDVLIGGGHAGDQLGWVHVGLGPARSAEVRIHWPDGAVGPWHHIEADQFAIMERDAAVRSWVPED